MSTSGYRPSSLNEEELRRLIRDALEDAPEQNKETYHARFHHLERGITQDDVIHGLEWSWTFSRAPEFNEDHWQWKYRIRTETIEGEEMEIILAVDTSDRSFEVITRWKR
jgi:hypothetical protein